jgi:hypothetical protein
MTKQLTTQNATITTAAVEVKTLTISGKQVTLAVFRQLIEEPLIAEDGTLNGIPWGTVNHCPEKKYWDTEDCEMRDCAPDPTHLHVVWQKSSELRRARVADPNWWKTPFWSEVAGAYVQAAYCINSHQLPDGMRRVRRDGYVEVRFLLGDMSCGGEEPDGKYVNGHECLTSDDLEQTKAVLREEIAAEHARRHRHREVRAALAELPQLFIAV